RLDLVADVDLGRRVVADEHDTQSRRTPASPGERRRQRPDLVADLIADRHAVEHSSSHQDAASASSFFNDSGRPSTTSLSPARIAVSGSGLKSIRPSCRWMPITMTPYFCRRLACRIERSAKAEAGATMISSIIRSRLSEILPRSA